MSAGDHTLVINVTQCINHTFIFDYITYTPSFSNLASMPSLVFTSPASTSASASSKHAPVGAIVGGVIGGLLVLVVIPLIIFWLRRRRKAKENLATPFGLASEGKPESASLLYLSAFLTVLSGFWFLDRNTPAPVQLEGKILSKSNHPPLDSATVSPFQGEGSSTSAHPGFSSFADRKRERNNNFSSATSGPSAVSSTARSMNDVASSSTTDLALPVGSDGLLASSPPAYEAIPAHRLPGQESLPDQESHGGSG